MQQKLRKNEIIRSAGKGLSLAFISLGICLFIVVGTRTNCPCQGPTMIRTAIFQNINEGTSKDAVGLNTPVTYRTN